VTSGALAWTPIKILNSIQFLLVRETSGHAPPLSFMPFLTSFFFFVISYPPPERYLRSVPPHDDAKATFSTRFEVFPSPLNRPATIPRFLTRDFEVCESFGALFSGLRLFLCLVFLRFPFVFLIFLPPIPLVLRELPLCSPF